MQVQKQSISVFEFDYLVCEDNAGASERIKPISPQAFTYLKKLCACEQSESRFLRPTFIDHCDAIQVKNYAGVLLTPDGTQIEILPKIAQTGVSLNAAANAEHARKCFLNMLKTLPNFRYLKTNSANVAASKMPLLDVFIWQFLQSVNDLIKRGLRSEYVPTQDNLGYLKGKLLVGKQLQHNFVNKHKFFVEYDEYLQDRPVNRLIHTALHKVSSYTQSAKTQKLLRELQFYFKDIPISSNVKGDFSRIKVDRGMSYYETPLAWARLILNDLSPTSARGQKRAASLLFAMESLFESYVASILTKIVPAQLVLKTQVRSKHLVYHNGLPLFQLKPDLLYQNKEDGENRVVLDTKWKLISTTSVSDNNAKYGLSQSDLYQMFAYGHKYLNGEGEVFLIYPRHADFSMPIQKSFDFTELQPSSTHGLRLWVVPFDCADGIDDSTRAQWPEASLLQQRYFNS